MLSQTAEYALRAVVHLARQPGDDPVRVDDVAEALSVPRNYLSKILHVLARDGVLTSTRGPKGGFRLATPATGLRLIDVVEEFDCLDEKGACLLGREVCGDDNPCTAHTHWKDVSATISTFFEHTTVADLAGTPIPRNGTTPRNGATP